MSDDVRAIRNLIDRWMKASKAGDTKAVLNMMTDDVVFMTCGRDPFGKEEFAAASATMKDMKIDGTAEVKEVSVHGDWAWARTLSHRFRHDARRKRDAAFGLCADASSPRTWTASGGSHAMPIFCARSRPFLSAKAETAYPPLDQSSRT